MPILTVTSRGQVTLRKEVLQHLGIGPGEKIELDMLPNGKASLRASRRTGKIEELFGFFKNDTDVKLTIEEIKKATEEAWAGRRKP